MQPGARFRIQMTLDGFPCKLEFEGKADGLKGIIERLNAIGAVPPMNTAKVSTPPTGDAPSLQSAQQTNEANHHRIAVSETFTAAKRGSNPVRERHLTRANFSIPPPTIWCYPDYKKILNFLLFSAMLRALS
ncbi:MAG: hypothetical protein L0220_23240 [Acidobacteria bacterium]|nr:hypothetical protein [Acidobacteriota bacterium]